MHAATLWYIQAKHLVRQVRTSPMQWQTFSVASRIPNGARLFMRLQVYWGQQAEIEWLWSGCWPMCSSTTLIGIPAAAWTTYLSSHKTMGASLFTSIVISRIGNAQGTHKGWYIALCMLQSYPDFIPGIGGVPQVALWQLWSPAAGQRQSCMCCA